MATQSPASLSPAEIKLQLWQRKADIPAWFSSMRDHARDVYFDSSLPPRSDETWHYGEPRRYTLDGLDIAHAQPGFNGVRYERICGLTGQPRRVACLSMVGDNVAEISSSTPLRDAGITVMALRQALALRADQVEHYMAAGLVPVERNKLIASHFALVDNGFYVHIPEGADAPEPIHLIMESGEPGSVVAPHVLVVAEARSRAKVFIHYLGKNHGDRNLQLGVIQSHVASGADVTVTKIEHVGSETNILTHEAAQLSAGAHYLSIAVHFGGKHLRHEAVLNLTEADAHGELLGMHLVRDTQRYDIYTHQNHQAPRCSSNLLFKGAIQDSAHASYQGLITVVPDAQRTDAYQSNRTLLLSPDARANSSPQLEIKADDVRCSHGSTISNVDERQMFYLQQRGLDEEQARRLIVSGFMAEVADRIPLATARDYVYNYVLERVAEKQR
jgi:Fe-S cluster assembly protein SufD